MLLLHGFPQTHLAWRHVAPALTDRFHVVCPDLPGAARRPLPPGSSASRRHRSDP
ncbi:alpha/beta fold hydrolase [Nocardia bhagyanarayanae]|uniref:alpha/beta fold hydrolase n=1 Tax=Nocardia bhagyanarayanae TaxID=1215925 RepID=UPI001FE98B24|nr:alpha/beta fold hydrolase [Nocardia bhagyanarayanae]